MSRQALLVLLGLAGVGLLTLLCANHHSPHIEADLTNRTGDALRAMGLPDAKISAEGMIVELNGIVPDEATKLRAGETAAKIWGVAEVRNNLRVEAPVVPQMTKEERKVAEDCQAEFNRLLSSSNIQFQTSSAYIARASHALLDKLAAAAASCPAARIEIGGHTDPEGGPEMNMLLSKRRAEAVVAYLTGKGVDKARLTAEGYGPNKPIADNSTLEGMSKNRRTEFKVKGL